MGAEEALALLEEALGLAGACVWPWGGGSGRIITATERIMMLAR